MNCRQPDEEGLARVELLLRRAAEYEPERPAPAGLALRALAPRTPIRRLRKFALGLGLAVSLAGTAATAVIVLRGAPADIQGPAVKPAVQQFGRPEIDPPPLNGDQIPAPAIKKRAEPTAPKISNAFEKKRITFGRKRRNYRTVRPEKPQHAVVARAELHEETVHRFETGILTPVMIAAPDPEGGATNLHPSVIEIPMEQRELITDRKYDSSFIRTISIKESE